jgi:membrane-associated phospholipid phosphatase
VRIDSESGSGVIVAPRALPAPARGPLAAIAVCSAVVVALLGSLFADDTTGTAFDVWIRSPLVDWGSPWRQLALIVDYTAEPVGGALTLAAVLFVCLKLGHRRAAVLAVAGTGASIAVTTALKPLVGRDINQGFLAFPSGHTATATALTLVLMLVYVQRRGKGVPLLAVVTVVAAFAMAWAQVLLNAHYPTDTIGGFCTALAVVPAVAYALDRFAERGQGLEIRK